MCGSTAIDLGCGCGEPGPVVATMCGSTAVDLGCGCGEPGPSGCDNVAVPPLLITVVVAVKRLPVVVTTFVVPLQ